ncbi:RNA-guided endonuclease InsQ/TnpB family protein [Candidatus Nitrosotalea okcheonensis]|uniref:Transposase n=1 Tax=Candidatus Nitrosotalea okcheonensis TaxID=1903276 RepID=A0A2H1FHM5_9ARCH|nr:RNA-guided endonuclease TnpB family protein [Candidatus Nitrosotalea okcheonensis]SMH72192.1 transposase [Candidatus Nitrosotalea okcheonensis]
MRNYKFRLYPTVSQEDVLVNNINVCRWVYNKFIDYSKKGSVSQFDLQDYLMELKQQESWLYNYHSKMLQMVCVQMSGSQKTLKSLRENGRKTGSLRFARYGEYRTFIYNQSGYKLENGKLTLSKIGDIKIKQHRTIHGKIKQVIITKTKSGKWYCSVSCELDKTQPPIINFKKSVGIDVGIKNFAYDSDVFVEPNPLNLKLLKPLVRMQKKMARRKYGSNNYLKAKKWYQIMHERIANRRKDFHHKLSTIYARKYDVIVVEKLNLIGMVKNHHLARNILDSGWNGFLQKSEYKTKMLIKVDPRNTSVECSECKTKVPKTLAIRIHSCPQCGLEIDRDHDASINILHKVIPSERRESTPVEISKRSMAQESHVFRHGQFTLSA